MAEATIRPSGWSASFDGNPPVPVVALTQTREFETVRSAQAMKPDPGWVFEDSHGHQHEWEWSNDDQPPEVTLSVIRQEPCDGACGDPDHTWPVYYCSECDEQFEPGYVPDYKARDGISIPTRDRVTLTVEELPVPLERLFDDRHRYRVEISGPTSMTGAGYFSGEISWGRGPDGRRLLTEPLEFEFVADPPGPAHAP